MNISILMVITFFLLILHVVLRRNSHNGVMLKNGKNFSVKEKKEILEVLDEMEIYYKDNKNHNVFSVGMCSNLHIGIRSWDLSDKLFKLYHNREYYRKMGLQTNIDATRDSFWWNTRDFVSRLKATLILKDAVIND